MLANLAWKKSPNRTEIGHLGAAVYLWNYGKFDVFHVNPPLVRFVAGAPIVLLCNPQYEWKAYSSVPQDRCEWKLGKDFIAANTFNDLRWYVFLARFACIPFVLIGGYFGFRFASELYTNGAGVIFLVLWTFSPMILGWGATICPDVAAASMGIIGLYTFWRWLKVPTWDKAIIAGICLGLMPLTKLTWIIAFPIWLAIWAVWIYCMRDHEIKPRFSQLAFAFVLAIYLVNVFYLFDGSFRPLKEYKFVSHVLNGQRKSDVSVITQGNRFEGSIIGYIPVPLPSEFVQGFDTQRADFERGIISYARGIYSDRGWWWYYGYALLFKEPLAVWFLCVLAVYASFNPSICGVKSFRHEFIVLIPLIVLFLFVSSQTGFSRHTRYIVPTLPLLYVFISKTASAIHSRKVFITFLILACLAWSSGSCLWHYPNSSSFFNELAGPVQQWPEFLLGSNLDCGQDLYELKNWHDNHPEALPIYVSYGDWFSRKRLGLDDIKSVPEHPAPGWFLISINQLYQKNGKYDWLRQYEPVEKIGYSIFVYRITTKQVQHTTERKPFTK